MYDYGEIIELIGAAGEYATRQYLQISGGLHTHLDNGVDFYWHGLKIDVKATKWTPSLESFHLQWPKTKPIKCDLAILCAVDVSLKKVLIIGFATHFDIENADINYNRDYPCHEMSVQDLYPIEKIFKIPDLTNWVIPAVSMPKIIRMFLYAY